MNISFSLRCSNCRRRCQTLFFSLSDRWIPAYGKWTEWDSLATKRLINEQIINYLQMWKMASIFQFPAEWEAIMMWPFTNPILTDQYVAVVLRELFFCYFIIITLFSYIFRKTILSLAIQSRTKTIHQPTIVSVFFWSSFVQRRANDVCCSNVWLSHLIQIRRCGIASHFPMFMSAISLWCHFFRMISWFGAWLVLIVALISVVQSQEINKTGEKKHFSEKIAFRFFFTHVFYS